MYLVPFFMVDRDLAARETRTLTLFEPRDAIPAGPYALVESYCPDPDCDCQRVMLNVIEEKRRAEYLARSAMALIGTTRMPGHTWTR